METKQVILRNWNSKQISINDIINNIFNILNLDDVGIKNKVIEISSNSTLENSSDKWLYALKVISICYIKNHKAFTQTQLYDLLTISAQIIDEKKKDVVNTITFKIYEDILENYINLNYTLKLIFPFIIINLMYILKYGHDIKYKPINLYAINNYYQNSKLNLEDELKQILSFNIENNPIRDKKIIEILEKLTEKNEKEILKSFQNLIESDRKKIEEICNNYQRIQEFHKIIERDDFSETFEKELGRKLSKSQFQHALYSIKKIKQYLENLLDGAFVPSGKYRINHVKHNIEYGLQLVGIIQSNKKNLIFNKKEQ